MREKPRITLGKKFTTMVTAMAVTLCAAALAISYHAYGERITEFYTRLTDSAAATLASQLTAEEMDDYFSRQKSDERYETLLRFAEDVAESAGLSRLSVVRPSNEGFVYLLDAVTEDGETERLYGQRHSLGDYEALTGLLKEKLNLLLAGETVDPVIQEDEDWGQWMTLMVPVRREDGTTAGYILAEANMNEMVLAQRQFLLYSGSVLALLAAAYAAVYLLMIRRSFIQPIRQLTQAALKYEAGEEQELFRQVEIRNNDELQSLASAFRMMLVEINLNNLEQQELAVREQRLETDLQLAKALNVSLLPRALPEREEGYPFSIQGYLEQGQELSCCFYDYFLLDGEQLCLLLGEVEGHGTPQIIYTVMAQATIKSQMRSGRPLSEAVTAANQQLYEVGGGLSIQVLIGVLEWTTGQFSYVNAGQQIPLLMRSQGYYAWQRNVSYAPLGQSENVCYQVERLQLRQGDRLFFHTRGLDEICSREGVPFGQKQLRIELNKKNNRQEDLADQLYRLHFAAGAYARRSVDIEGYALMALEYRRRDKAQAYCVLSPDTAGSADLTAFLRGQLEANSIRGGQLAQTVVLADELFTLCCHRAARDSHIMVEWTFSREERLAVLRFRGNFGGVDPMEGVEPAMENAAAFVRTHCDQLLFEHIESMDTVMMVKHLRTSDQTDGTSGTQIRQEESREAVLQ